MNKRIALVAMFSLTTGLTTACSSSEEPEEDELVGVFVARLAGSGVWAAATVEQGEAAVFLCGADDKLATHSRWIGGATVSGDTVEASADGFTTSWSLGDSPSLTVTEPDGTTLDGFAVKPTDTSSLEGVYVSFDANCTDGVIVFSANEDGSDVEALGAWCNDIGDFSQVTPILPWTLEASLQATVTDPAIGDKAVTFEVAAPSAIP